ncbi:MAG: type II toxin-antitoxin system Phd/YefM family antitoxin [Candidatus Omnitrophota bacterium]|nr:type II toxin-antitoxin system Phd/YefM family antitoxin [Candidatus Omnitrophota bacterium]
MNITITISLTELRPKLPQIMDRISKRFDRYVITRHGKPEAVLLSEEDYEGLLETIDILSDKEAMNRIKKAKADFKRGKWVPWEKAKKKIEKILA